MKKLIEISQEYLIVCDNKTCDFKIPNITKDANTSIKGYVNKPCPDCGENLLTEKDYIDSEKLMRVLNWMNKYFSWLTIFSSKKSETKVTAHVHNGVDFETESKH